MVVHDSEFQVDLRKLSDNQLQDRRLKFVRGLYNGEKGSRDNVEKVSLIQEVDIERELRFKRKAEQRSNLALFISTISLGISIIALLLS
jgi:hypothetical protein